MTLRLNQIKDIEKKVLHILENVNNLFSKERISKISVKQKIDGSPLSELDEEVNLLITKELKAFEEFPEIKFKYIGTNDDKTREVCKRALKLPPLTRKEIDALGYVSFTDRGGYNCRHDWVRAK